jgi:hypothetical protein
MADSKLPALTEVSVPDLADPLYLVDVSDTTDDATGSSRKVSLSRLLGLLVGTCQGRLTLSPGNAVYSPDRSLTPSATSTVNDTVDFAAAHGWTTGTAVTPDATGGGLTAGTIYYINAADSDTISFHTTVAAAEAGTSKVDLTASITAAIKPIGVSRTSVYFTPHNGNRVALYDGTRWRLYSFSEITLALGTLTADRNYDVFLYDNAGTLTLELSAAWGTVAGVQTRTDALALQDGVWVKSGATTRRYVGTIRTNSTTTTIMLWLPPSGTRARLFVWSAYNQVDNHFTVVDETDSWTYSTSTWRSWNNSDENRVEYVVGLAGAKVTLDFLAMGSGGGAFGVGLDSATAKPHDLIRYSAVTGVGAAVCPFCHASEAGYHFLQLMEIRESGTFTIYGDAGTPDYIACGGVGAVQG